MPDLQEQLSAAVASRYRIQRELGQGGMAKVFLAHDLKYDREVAVKVLRPDLAADVGATRFLHEIQTSARLHHPHILPLYDSDHDDGLVYYVMPYIQGETLRQRLARERQLPVGEAIQLAREVLDALAYAHGANVVHRDIKPANILLDAGHALVADFGIARAIGEGESVTGHVIGTPAYMSPEQIDGSKYLDGRTDIYGLGCVLFEMLVGEPPFRGSTLTAVIANRLSAPLPSARTFREVIPEAVDAAIKKAMAVLPADRFVTAAQFSDALGTSATVAIAVGAAQVMVQEVITAKSVAVLPFENMSTDPENEYFSDGITDDISDPRVTTVGRWLRRSYLDELPQLFNVLNGTMSLIGPRPIVPDELVHYGAAADELLHARPGMVGAWTSCGLRRPDYPERAQLELDYIRNRSPRRDLVILARTIPVVLRGQAES
jgi:serine/threonine-protein kinase